LPLFLVSQEARHTFASISYDVLAASDTTKAHIIFVAVMILKLAFICSESPKESSSQHLQTSICDQIEDPSTLRNFEL
jgi:hypothetical protein